MSPIRIPAETTTPAKYDVVVVGGGPVGLLLAYQLARFNVSVCVVEKEDKQGDNRYGRAITLFPRTCELLEALDLIGPVLQQGFACRSSVTYKDGVRQFPGRVWTFMENIKETVFDFALVLRQMYTEDILRDKMHSVGAVYHTETGYINFEVDPTATMDDHAVTTHCLDLKTQNPITFQSKYIIGADGGRSLVRKHANIPFDGDTSEDQWIRIDGIVETDMPITRAYGAIESKTHGNVLWAPLDHGATRIGYAYTPEIAEKYPDGVTQEVAVAEALEAMRPFRVEFKEVHWWTLYKIGQRVARTFTSKDSRVFLCGDAAHTHSSGAAQGLNTGIHDATNLAWKLALHIHGLSQPGVLSTYGTERKDAVETLISYDKDISLLMTHKWPAWYTGDRGADPYLVLGEIFERAAAFNTGLGISYAENVVNRGGGGDGRGIEGCRAPDVDVVVPGLGERVRLHRVIGNVGRFSVVVFTGCVERNVSALMGLRRYLDGEGREMALHRGLRWFTVCAGTACSTYEALGMEPFGDTYFDSDAGAHAKYGIGMDRGGVVVIRPDGLVSFTCGIHASSLEEYIWSVLRR